MPGWAKGVRVGRGEWGAVFRGVGRVGTWRSGERGGRGRGSRGAVSGEVAGYTGGMDREAVWDERGRDKRRVGGGGSWGRRGRWE